MPEIHIKADAGHPILPVSLSPYQLQGSPNRQTIPPTLNFFSPESWASLSAAVLPCMTQLFYLPGPFATLFWASGSCTWFRSLPSPLSPSSHGLAQGHINPGLSQTFLPLAMFSHMSFSSFFFFLIQSSPSHLIKYNMIFICNLDIFLVWLVPLVTFWHPDKTWSIKTTSNFTGEQKKCNHIFF
jgi:hypothetical protein